MPKLPYTETDELVQNHALLVGEIAGALSSHLKVQLEVDEDRCYTGRIFIDRPSGRWVVTVAPYKED